MDGQCSHWLTSRLGGGEWVTCNNARRGQRRGGRRYSGGAHYDAERQTVTWWEELLLPVLFSVT